MKKSLANVTQKGFTIVELIVVIVVIGILATIVTVAYSSVQASARDSSVLSDLDSLDGIETSYGLKNNTVGLAWYSGSGPNSDINFTPSSDNIIDVVINSTDYCIRAYNPNSASYKTLSTAAKKESTPGVCTTISPSIAAQAGGSGPSTTLAWTQRSGVGTCCQSIAISSDGNKLAGVTNTSFFYSSDNGATWSSSAPFANNSSSIAMSSDGSRMFVATSNYVSSPVYMSTNFGASWTTPTSAKETSSISTSSDGSKVAVDNFGAVRTSSNSGVTWINGNTSGGGNYPAGDNNAVDVSGDGSTLLSSGGNYTQDNLWLSSDMGQNWTKLTGAPVSYYWTDGVAVSGNGAVLYAINRPVSSSINGNLYKSINNGASWLQMTLPSSTHWSSVDTSDDGLVVAVAAMGGYIYTSTNGGATWTENTSIGSRAWSDVAVSSDGSKVVATAGGGIVYTGVYGP